MAFTEKETIRFRSNEIWLLLKTNEAFRGKVASTLRNNSNQHDYGFNFKENVKPEKIRDSATREEVSEKR